MATQSPGDSIASDGDRAPESMSLVVCSLEPWGEVRRRIRMLVDEIVDLDPTIEVLFVCPALDVPHELRHGRLPDSGATRLTKVHPRIHVLRPRKWLPRSVGPFADRSLERQVLDAVGELGLRWPLLWVNDAGYARFALDTGWPSLYDITDDWLLAPLAPRQRTRLEENERLLLEHCDAVVVCSPELARTRGRTRPVELIPNGVDVELFRTPRSRPPDLPPAPVAVYVGTLHAERIDIPLVLELARNRPDVHLVLVGPASLPGPAVAELESVPSIHLLGPRPYDQVPAYLQHADLVIVPHLVNPFTESLDPIKAYECLAAGRPTVATPVAGFRQLGAPVVVADREHFAKAVSVALEEGSPVGSPPEGDEASIPSWRQRAETFGALMGRVREQRVTR